MNIVVLYPALTDAHGSSPHEDPAQVEAVEAALQTLGHRTRRLACTLNFEAVEQALASDRPELVFNLVRSLGGYDRLGHLAAALLDDLDLPYTGAPAFTLHVTSHKPRAKGWMRARGLPTPDWLLATSPPSATLTPPYIIKAVWEHASRGLDEHAVITEGDGSMVRAQIESRSRQLGQPCFAERFIAGREFHLALIAAGDQPRVLPPAEIDFSNLPPGKPRIVRDQTLGGLPEAGSATCRWRFDLPPHEAPLLDWLKALALDCWQTLKLAGYAQIDFRVDERGRPWILEVNANPSLAPHGLVAAALARAGLPLVQAIQWIVEDALRPQKALPEELVVAPLGTLPAGAMPVGAKAAGTPADGAVSSAAAAGGAPAAAPAAATIAQAASRSATVLRQTEQGQAESAAEAASAEVLATASARGKPRSAAVRRPRGVKLRRELNPDDVDLVQQIVAASGAFRVSQAEQAKALVARRLAEGPACGLEVVIAQRKDDVVGFLLYARDPLSVSSFDILWIAVEPSQQQQGIGQMLLQAAEEAIAAAGGTQIVLQTLEHPEEPDLRAFYEHRGYARVAVLEDYYGPGENQALYRKVLAP